jgi:hypothetical protein
MVVPTCEQDRNKRNHARTSQALHSSGDDDMKHGLPKAAENKLEDTSEDPESGFT